MIHDRSKRCPELSELADFASARLSQARLEQMALHIDHCETCGNLLDSESSSPQSGLVEDLRGIEVDHDRVGAGSVGPGISVPQSLLDIARRAKDGAGSEVSFDAGRRLANQLSQGPVRLGRYELESVLGVGTFGYVFRARDAELNRWVALKVQRAGTLASDLDVDRFLREAQSVARLNHPGIVVVHDSIRSDDNVCCIVTEYVDGDTLDQSMKKGHFSISSIVEAVALIGEAIQYAHEQGVIHRDIKPSNVMLDRSGKPRVMDFGLAKVALDANASMTSEGRVLGTPAYMSPEQAAGESKQVDARSDVYSLGVILYEWLTGERPFQGNRRMLLLQVLEDEPRSPRQLNSAIPRDLETICLKALAKSPARRYASAAAMVDDLQRFLNQQPIQARPIGRSEKLWRWCRNYPLAASLLVAVPLISIGGFIHLWSLSTQFVESTALESTRMEANMLEDINEYYSEEVIGHLDREVVPVTHRYTTTPNSVPLPFTFMIDAGRRVSEGESGMLVRIYSDYPWRQACGPHDDFERRAIQELGLGCRTMEEPVNSKARTSAKVDVDGRTYFEFSELDDQPVLRYARAQIMKQSCIDCHNNDPSSPKRDWVVGEVAGVLSITRPLQRDIELAQSSLRSAFNLIAWLATGLTTLTLFVFWSARRRPSIKNGAYLHEIE